MNQLAVYEKVGGQNITPIFDNKKLDLLKSTICKGATDEEFELFLHACQRTGLDPFMRQIYSVKRWDSNLRRECMTIQTGIDGYRLIADRTGKYSPGKEPTYTYNSDGKLISATAYVEKQTADGRWHTVAATAFYEEYYQKTKDGKPTRFWQQMPHVMLGKVAEALALRKAFPGDLSGLYTKEEMQQADYEDVINTSQHIPVNHIVESNEMIDNIPKEDEIVKYISKSQIKMFNEKYDMVANPASEFYDEKTKEMIYNAVSQLKIEGFPGIDKMKDIKEFPSIEKMKECDWIRLMKAFDKYFEKKKKLDLAEKGIQEYSARKEE